MLKRTAALVWRWLPGPAKAALAWGLNAHFIVGTVAVVQDTEGRVLLAHHTYRKRVPWALPGGWVRRGEDPKETIVREIREETGLEVAVDRILTIQRESPRHLTIIYAAQFLGGQYRPSDEVSEVRFVRQGEWPPGMREDHKAVLEGR